MSFIYIWPLGYREIKTITVRQNFMNQGRDFNRVTKILKNINVLVIKVKENEQKVLGYTRLCAGYTYNV